VIVGIWLTVSEVRRHRALLWSIFRSHEFACVDEVERSNTFLTSSGYRLALTMSIQNGRHFHFGAFPRLTNPAKHLLPKVQSQLHLQCKPVYEWEKNDQVPNVVFVEGLVRDGNHWLFYYGSADKYVGVASAVVR